LERKTLLYLNRLLNEVGTMPEKNMTRFQSPCAKYVYDPEAGDFERNIPPGTPFENLPDDWCCPKCGAEKEYFEELEQ
jgi:rubredoxin